MNERRIIEIMILMATVLSAGAAIVGWSYETFEQKDSARERLASTEKRLERIENKIDAIVERIGSQRKRD